MPHSTLPLVDTIAEEARRVGVSAHTDGIRAQVAFVRALADEIGRYHPSEQRVAALHDQLGEELSRLVELVPKLGAREVARQTVAPIDVMVVDDDESALRATAAAVREFGLPVRTAKSGEEALAEYGRKPAAVVLTDWNMPGMTGLDLCRVLKDRDPHAYVILLTAHDVAEGARHGGVDDFLRKPVELTELEVRLRAAAKLVQAVRTVALIALHLQTRGRELDA